MPVTRREFLQTSSAVSAAPGAMQAAGGAASPGLRLGFDAYSIRGFEWDPIQLLDYAAGLKLDTVHMDLNDFKTEDAAYARRVKEHAAQKGLLVEGSIGCVCRTSNSWNAKFEDPVKYLVRGLRLFHECGATIMRCFLGSGAERNGPVPLEKHVEEMVKALRAARPQAMDWNMRIAVETHGDLQCREMKDLVEAAGKEFVGVCLDSGNSVAVLDDPQVALEALGPYTLTTHTRDAVLFEQPKGAAMQWVALGDGIIDFKQYFSRFRQICPGAGVNLEILTGSPPRQVPYLEPDFWKAYPKTLASDFARYLALVKNGRPFLGAMLIAGRGDRPAAYEAALKEQQRYDLERSLEYAKKELGLGIRWKA